jgi:hypothetical protein
MELMGFFDLPDPEPDDDELDEEDENDGYGDLRPAAWAPGVVPVELVVVRSAQAAVAVSRVSAYPDGFELIVSSYVHRSVKRRRGPLLRHPMMWHDMGDPGEPIPDELLRFGLAWPDGGRATNLDDWGRRRPDATEPAHGLEPHGGGGSDREYSQEYWAWPLPGPGPVGFVVEWPAFGISETTATIDGDQFVNAATRSHPIWPEDADRASHVSRAAMMRAHNEDHGQSDGGFADR